LDARVLQRAPLVSFERIDLLADHGADTLRRCEIHLRQWPEQRPSPISLCKIAALAEVLQEVGGEEWMSFGFFVNERRQFFRKIVWRKRRVDVLGNVLARPR